MLRLKEDYIKHLKVLFGTYCEVHDEPNLSNSIEPQIQETIILGPSGNLQGTIKFFSLDTSMVLRRWKSIVCKVEKIA